MKNVDVIVVSYNTRELTQRAVESALGEVETRGVVVVDNDSRDGSAAHLGRAFASSPVTVLALARNVGFGAACNRGARSARAEFLFFLNSDAEVRPGCLQALRRRLAGSTDIGIAAPAIYCGDGASLQAGAQGVFPTATRILTRRRRGGAASLEPDWVSGVALMARRQEFLDLGGFCEDFFLYYEDVELCWRYRRAGRRIVREPRAAVVHAGGQSSTSARVQKRLYYASQDRYLARVGTPWIGRQLVRLLRWPYALLQAPPARARPHLVHVAPDGAADPQKVGDGRDAAKDR